MENLISLWASSGIAQLQLGQLVMMTVGLTLLFLAISKGFEPLLLVPIGFGTILAGRGMGSPTPIPGQNSRQRNHEVPLLLYGSPQRLQDHPKP